MGRKKSALLEGLQSFFQSLHFLRCYVRELWRIKESCSVSKASNFFRNTLEKRGKIQSFPRSLLFESCAQQICEEYSVGSQVPR